MNLLTAILSGPSGKPSSVRTMAVFVTTSIMLTWTYVSVAKCELQPLSEWHVGALAVAIGAKAWQRGREGQPGEKSEFRSLP